MCVYNTDVLHRTKHNILYVQDYMPGGHFHCRESHPVFDNIHVTHTIYTAHVVVSHHNITYIYI